MHKITKPATVCEHCGSIKKPEEYDSFCDFCKNKLNPDYDKTTQITIFFKDSHGAEGHSYHYEFCSIKCLREFLQKLTLNKKLIEFFALPHPQSYEELKELLAL